MRVKFLTSTAARDAKGVLRDFAAGAVEDLPVAEAQLLIAQGKAEPVTRKKSGDE